MKWLLAVILLVLTGCSIMDAQSPQLVTGGGPATMPEIAASPDAKVGLDMAQGEVTFIEWVDVVDVDTTIDVAAQEMPPAEVGVSVDVPPTTDTASDVVAELPSDAGSKEDTLAVEVAVEDVQAPIPDSSVLPDTADAYYPGKDSDKDGVDDLLEAALGTDPSNPDTDGGGLSDGEEVAGKTSPTKADTDSDGLKDGLEKKVYGTDPTVADTDSDGLSDGAEVGYGTSPVSADTDKDGLSDGLELGLVGDTEPSTKTDPLKKDTDGNGASDGDEDKNKDGKKDILLLNGCKAFGKMPTSTFPEGSTWKFVDALPAHYVEYSYCVDEGACKQLDKGFIDLWLGGPGIQPCGTTPCAGVSCAPSTYKDEPVQLYVPDAVAFCKWKGGYLPTGIGNLLGFIAKGNKPIFWTYEDVHTPYPWYPAKRTTQYVQNGPEGFSHTLLLTSTCVKEYSSTKWSQHPMQLTAQDSNSPVLPVYCLYDSKPTCN